MRTSKPPVPRVGLSIVLIVVLLAVGGGLGGLLIMSSIKPPRSDVVAKPPLVDVLVVHPENVVRRFVGYGTASAMRSASVAAELSATVVERVGGVRAGTMVVDGQTLIRLDEREYRHALERAEAQADAQRATLAALDSDKESLEALIKTADQELRVAREERDRLVDLYERQLAAKKEYDFANLAYQQARRVGQAYQRELAMVAPRREEGLAALRAFEAEASFAKLNIERCVIRAPFGGCIDTLLVDAGDHVAPGVVVLRVVDSSRVEVPVQLPTSVHGLLDAGADCRVTAESVPGMAWSGTVARVAPVADTQTRTFAAYVVVDNQDQPRPLMPGAFVRAEVLGPTLSDRLLVPRSALRDDHVFVVEGGIVELRRITVEQLIEDRALLTGELHSGDAVVLSHLDKITTGSPVRVPRSASAVDSSNPAAADASP